MLKVNLSQKQKLSQVFHLTHLLPGAAESQNSSKQTQTSSSQACKLLAFSPKCYFFIYFISWLRRIEVKRSFWLWFQSICWTGRGNHFSSNPLIIRPKTKRRLLLNQFPPTPLPSRERRHFLGHEAGVPISFSTWILHFYTSTELLMPLRQQKGGAAFVEGILYFFKKGPVCEV